MTVSDESNLLECGEEIQIYANAGACEISSDYLNLLEHGRGRSNDNSNYLEGVKTRLCGRFKFNRMREGEIEQEIQIRSNAGWGIDSLVQIRSHARERE